MGGASLKSRAELGLVSALSLIFYKLEFVYLKVPFIMVGYLHQIVFVIKSSTEDLKNTLLNSFY